MPYLKIGKFEIALWTRSGGTVVWFGYADHGWQYEDGDVRDAMTLSGDATRYQFRQFVLHRFRPDADQRDWTTLPFFKFHTNLLSRIRSVWYRMI
jgi:hypothetical protein